MAFPTTTYTITVATTALTCINDTSTVLNALLATGGRWSIHITTETGGIRYRYDGTDPTTTVGHVLGADGALDLSGTDIIRRFRMIRNGSTSSTVTVSLTGQQQ